MEKFVIDNNVAQEDGYAGISAKTVELWGSTTSADSGYTKLMTVTAPKKDRGVFPMPNKPVAQWLKIVVSDNWGHKKFVEVAEFEAYGQPIGKPVNPTFTGVYMSN